MYFCRSQMCDSCHLRSQSLAVRHNSATSHTSGA